MKPPANANRKTAIEEPPWNGYCLCSKRFTVFIVLKPSNSFSFFRKNVQMYRWHKTEGDQKAPRNAYLFRKADWVEFKTCMKSFCDSFMFPLEGKTVEVLWCNFKEALNLGINKFIPSRFVGSKRHLPWITQAIKREIQKQDHLFQKYKKSKDPKDRTTFLNSKHGVKQDQTCSL